MNKTSKGMAAFMAALALNACATMEGGGQRSALDRSIGQCVATVAIGAIIGALADKNCGQGAAIGAGIGGVACGVLIAINNEKDKQRVREAQLAALNANMARTEQFVGEDGQARTVETSVREAATPPNLAMRASQVSFMPGGDSNPGMTTEEVVSHDTFVGPCRTAQSQIAVQGQVAQLPSELFCRTAGGDWKLYNG